MNYKKLGKNIKEQRTNAGLSQTDLAKKTGVTQQKVAQWEKGCNMQLDTIEKIANGLDVSGLELLGNVFEEETKKIAMIYQRDETEIYALEDAKAGDPAVMVEYNFIEEGIGLHNFDNSFAVAIKGKITAEPDKLTYEDFEYKIYPEETRPKLIIGWPIDYESVSSEELSDGEEIDWDKYAEWVDKVCNKFLVCENKQIHIS